VVVVWSAIERTLHSRAEPRSLTAHPLTKTHLVISLLLPHAQITPVCLSTFDLYSDMPLLLWLLWFVATFEKEGGELAAPGLFFWSAAYSYAAVPTKAGLDGFEQYKTVS
jgi:hypothetical protein